MARRRFSTGKRRTVARTKVRMKPIVLDSGIVEQSEEEEDVPGQLDFSDEDNLIVGIATGTL